MIPFQGFIACLANTCRETATEQDVNLWAMRDVVNKPDHTMEPTVFPDGFAAKLVLLGDLPDIMREPWKVPRKDLARWWPKGENDRDRTLLLQRLQDDIPPLRLHLALALTLLAELYMTPQGSKAPLTTLRVAASPVTDFGLCFGSCPGSPKHCYAFKYPDGRVERGADSANHVWMYFQTADGHEYYLDMTLNLFGLGTHVEAKPFWQGQGEALTFVTDYVGMFWLDKRLYPADLRFYTERNRLSVLRSNTLPQIARYLHARWDDAGLPQRIIMMTVTSFAKLLTGQELLWGDALHILKWAVRSMRRTRRMLDAQLWRTWPETPVVFSTMGPPGDTGPGIPMTPVDVEQFVERTKRFAARSRRATSRERKHL